MTLPAVIQEISDIERYNQRMSKSIPDKLFFVQHVDVEVFVDFGCGNGELIFELAKIYPRAKFYGFDESIKMVLLSKRRDIPGAKFFNTFEKMMLTVYEEMKMTDRMCLILSSVLHEVMAYKTLSEAYKIWDQLSRMGADYVVIRDMAINRSYYNFPIEESEVMKIHKKAEKFPGLQKQLNDFINQWGVLSRGSRFAHFLLKYHYADNWDRELPENYLLLVDDIEQEFIKQDYEEVLRVHHVLPYLHDKIKRDFDIDLKEPTHIKLIYKKESPTCLL